MRTDDPSLPGFVRKKIVVVKVRLLLCSEIAVSVYTSKETKVMVFSRPFKESG